MQTHRIFEKATARVGEQVQLSIENGRVIRDVLRMKTGDQLEILIGDGKILHASLVQVTKRHVSASIEREVMSNMLRPTITLLQGLPKGEKPARIVQKAVEMGVTQVMFFECEHSVAKGKDSLLSRMDRVAIEAMRQSGNAFLPEISCLSSLRDALTGTGDAGLKIFFDERDRIARLRDQLQGASIDRVALAIGPEGGWSETDRKTFQASGFVSTGLGPYTLRTETAAIAAIASVRALLS